MKNITLAILLITIGSNGNTAMVNNPTNYSIYQPRSTISSIRNKTPLIETRATKGSKRVGGYNSKGKGSHYVHR